VQALVSLVTCSRDPDDSLLQATLASVRSLRIPDGWTVEHLLVDNGSVVPLETRPSVREHLASVPWAHLTRDDLDGLAGVRARVIRATRGELLVTVDDDNVLDPHYLEALVSTARAMPSVGVFGAGRIDVAYRADPPAWARDPWVLRLFQQRALPTTVLGTSRFWQAHYPPGTGMAVRRSVADEFARSVLQGSVRNASRTRARLSGGEDAQLIWIAVRAGLSIGAFPAMRLSHVIPARRLTPVYVRRLTFGIHESAPPARREVFRDEALPPLTPLRAFARVLRDLPPGAPPAVWWAQFASGLGDAAALCRMHERPEPWWLRALIALLRVR